MIARPAPESDEQQITLPLPVLVARNGLEPVPYHGTQDRPCPRCGGLHFKLRTGTNGGLMVRCIGCGAWVSARRR